MTATVRHPAYGEIVFRESFWTGKRELTVNGSPLLAVNKKSFIFRRNGENLPVSVKGSFFTGTKLVVEDEEITLTPPAKWYECACSAFIFVLILIWGSSPVLCSIVPVVGGAIGGAIAGAMAVTNLLAMKSAGKLWLKIAIFVVFTVATFLLCFAIALGILSLL